jgi:hypothetical protein
MVQDGRAPDVQQGEVGRELVIECVLDETSFDGFFSAMLQRQCSNVFWMAQRLPDRHGYENAYDAIMCSWGKCHQAVR